MSTLLELMPAATACVCGEVLILQGRNYRHADGYFRCPVSNSGNGAQPIEDTMPSEDALADEYDRGQQDGRDDADDYCSHDEDEIAEEARRSERTEIAETLQAFLDKLVS